VIPWRDGVVLRNHSPDTRVAAWARLRRRPLPWLHHRVASGYFTGTSRRDDWGAESLLELSRWAHQAVASSAAACHGAHAAAPGGGAKGFSTDWFVAVIWSIMGSGVITQEFFAYLTHSPASVYLWPAWGEAVAGSRPAMMICHIVETVACEQMPGLAGAFSAAHVSISHILLRWLSHGFLNYLHWEDILHFTCLKLVMGPDYIIYFLVALLRHCESEARQHAAQADLVPWILQSQLGSFRLTEYLDYIGTLEAEYKPFVLSALLNNIPMPPS